MDLALRVLLAGTVLVVLLVLALILLERWRCRPSGHLDADRWQPPDAQP